MIYLTPPQSQPLKASVPPLLSYWSSATMKNNSKYKKTYFQKKSYIEVALYLSINGASSTGATL